MKIITAATALSITYFLFVSLYWIIAILSDTEVNGIWMAIAVILIGELIGLMVLLISKTD